MVAVQWKENFSTYRAHFAGYVLLVSYKDNKGYKVSVTNGDRVAALKEYAGGIEEGKQKAIALMRRQHAKVVAEFAALDADVMADSKIN